MWGEKRGAKQRGGAIKNYPWSKGSEVIALDEFKS